MARGNKQSKGGLSKAAVRQYDEPTEGLRSDVLSPSPGVVVEQLAARHAQDLGFRLSDWDATQPGTTRDAKGNVIGSRSKFIDKVDTSKKSGRNIVRDMLTRDLLRDPTTSGLESISVRSYADQMDIGNIGSVDIIVVTTPENAPEIMDRIETIVESYRYTENRRQQSFAAEINLVDASGKRIDTKFI